jgi:hypothetical protein
MRVSDGNRGVPSAAGYHRREVGIGRCLLFLLSFLLGPTAPGGYKEMSSIFADQ